ncbi:MAG: type I secretion C-terminal target domain-containing protein [Devosia nanyangense]|uniref:Type I secretion C-terminal target domain-containing protein n=1 Tax=Devosia nanyangense TaxID=1228055 RepID=A0A933L1R5_9HYPH|nr:type I secretion C-terminal target domain-containing protein [Devosia nanyangense]
MANFTPREQLMLELVNRARMDPNGEAARYGITLNQGLAAGAISSTPKQVLAGNDQLRTAASSHSAWMINNDLFQHNELLGTLGFAGVTPTARMTAAGYAFSGSWSNGENIAFVGTTGALDATQAIYDEHRNLFLSTHGHRQNLLMDNFREVGIGQVNGGFTQSGVTYNSSMITQDFTVSGSKVFVTGVVYNDTVSNDNFFTVGEQTASRAVTVTGGFADSTGPGGGYELGFTSGGAKTISFDLSGGAVSVKLTLGSANLKVDVVNGTEVWTNASVASLSTVVKELHALGISAMSLTGSAASEKIFGNSAANALSGAGGNDSLSGSGGNDSLIGGSGHDKLTGGSGADRFVFKAASESGLDAAHDTIADFQDSGADVIDLSAVWSGTLTYRGISAFTGADQVRVTASGSDVIVHVNLDADSTDEMQILLTGTKLGDMLKGDFIL